MRVESAVVLPQCALGCIIIVYRGGNMGICGKRKEVVKGIKTLKVLASLFPFYFIALKTVTETLKREWLGLVLLTRHGCRLYFFSSVFFFIALDKPSTRTINFICQSILDFCHFLCRIVKGLTSIKIIQYSAEQ